MMSPILSGCCAEAGVAARSAATMAPHARCASRMMSSRRLENAAVTGLAGAALVGPPQRKAATQAVKAERPDRVASRDMLSGTRTIQARRDAQEKSQPETPHAADRRTARRHPHHRHVDGPHGPLCDADHGGLR